MRLDLAGFGDSAPAAGGLRFEEGAVRDLRRGMDYLAETRGLTRFVAAGLCSGADVSLKLAAEDPRVEQAVLIDPFSYETRLFWLQGYAHRLLRRESWSSFIHGDSHIRRQPRAVCVARVRTAAASEPASASLSMKQPR